MDLPISLGGIVVIVLVLWLLGVVCEDSGNESLFYLAASGSSRACASQPSYA